MFGFSLIRGFMRWMLRRSPRTAVRDAVSEWYIRRQGFNELWARYENSVYQDESEQGFKKQITKQLKDLGVENLEGLFAPFGRVADAYSGILNGPFGVGIDIEQNVPKEGVPCDDKLRNPVKKIWDDSSFDVNGPLACLTAAVTGIQPYRIWPRPGKSRPVVIRLDDPSWIKIAHFDDDGNVIDVLLEYETTEERSDDPKASQIRSETVKWTEFIGKDVFWKKRNKEMFEAVRPNPLGVCPYVIMKHGDTGLEFGESAITGSLQIVDSINAILCHLMKQVRETVYGQWVYAGTGEMPKVAVPMGPSKMFVIQTDGMPGGNELKCVTPNLDFEKAMHPLNLLVRELKNRHPEIRTNEIEAMANQSGETIAQLRLAGEEKKKRVAIQYEHYTKRAFQIALSWGVLNGEWDLGAGMGVKGVSTNLGAAERSFNDGMEDFRFKARALTPRTNSELAVIRKNNADAFVSETAAALNIEILGSAEEALRTLKYTDEEIEDIKAEMKDETAIAAVKAKAQARIIGRGVGAVVQADAVKPGDVLKPAGDLSGGRRDSGAG